MLRHVLFDLSLFSDENDRANSQKRVLWLLQALTNCNRLYLQQHPDTPLIYKSGIVYKAPQQFEPDTKEIAELRAFLKQNGASGKTTAALDAISKMVGGEIFREIPRIIENGGGDCDNVASWRVAELCERGIDAQPYITWRRRLDGGWTYHVIVRWPDGSSEDPSLLLGMGGEGRASDRREEERKLGERLGDFLAGKMDTVFGTSRRATTVLGQWTPNAFQDSIPFQTDDAYADWSPTRPAASYADPRYPGMTASAPYVNTRWTDADDMDDVGDRDDKFDGDGSPIQQIKWVRALRRALKRAA